MEQIIVSFSIQYQASGALNIEGQTYHPGATDHIALSQAVQVNLHDLVPEGYALVSTEPTERMIEAFFEEMDKRGFHPAGSDLGRDDVIAFFKAMIAAQGEGE